MKNNLGSKLLNLFLIVILVLSSFLPLTKVQAADDITLNVSSSQSVYAPGDLVELNLEVTRNGEPETNSKPSVTVTGPNYFSINENWDQSQANPDGSFTMTFRLPEENSTGVYTVELHDTVSDEDVITTFKVEESEEPSLITNVSINFDKEMYFPGDSVIVSGKAKENGEYKSNAPVAITLDGEGYQQHGQEETNSQGEYSADFTLPKDLTGVVDVTVGALEKKFFDSFKVNKEEVNLPEPIVKLTETEEGIQVDWNDSNEISTYDVQVSTEDGDFETVASGLEKSEYVYQDVEAGETYYVRVKAYDEAGHTSLSATESIELEEEEEVNLPEPEVTLTETEEGIEVDWNDSDEISTYDVQVSTDNEAFEAVASGLEESMYVYQDVEAGETYYIRVKAYDEDGNTSLSSTESIELEEEEEVDENEENEDENGTGFTPPSNGKGNKGNNNGSSNPSKSKKEKASKKVDFSTEEVVELTLTEEEKENAKKQGLKVESEELELDIPAEVFREVDVAELTLEKSESLADIEEFNNGEQLPVWAETVKNVIHVEVGNKEQTFAAPVKMTFKGDGTSRTKKVAKFKQDKNNLYAITRPTKREDGKYVTLTPRFSAYGLIGSPNKVTGNVSSEGETKEVTLEGKGKIYYTTDSLLVEHIYSEDNDLTAYSINRDDIDFDKWNEYDQAFTVDENETVFAVTVKHNVIGLVSKITSPNVKVWDAKTDVKEDKEFTIGFDTALAKRTVNSKYVYITNEDGERIDTIVTLSDDEQSVTVKPVNNYRINETYTLHISQNIESEFGKFLKESVEMNFSR